MISKFYIFLNSLDPNDSHKLSSLSFLETNKSIPITENVKNKEIASQMPKRILTL